MAAALLRSTNSSLSNGVSHSGRPPTQFTAESQAIVPVLSATNGLVSSNRESGSYLRPLYMNNPNAHLVDALPYVDPLSSDFEGTVKSLINEEMQKITDENNGCIPDYLINLPLSLTPHFDDETSLTHNELKRVAAGKPMEKLDFSHYESIEEPSAEHSGDVSEWKKAVETTQALLEHSSNSSLNLQLMTRFAQEAWLSQISQFQTIKQWLEKKAQDTRAEVDLVNKQRKVEQVECGNELRNFASEKADMIKRNGNIVTALSDLEGEVARLQIQCRERGTFLPGEDEESLIEENMSSSG
ncbi:hypothetical protein IE077_002967 [Cardiosporidium cionae]|uniref:Pre-mRNA-splicing factor SPF27 n=1 Tax=Cardiosporidium cionae TaxID=476202 RepID=A0ABQ7J9K4_9APIC|nr:hypothetical protein IE077_002967 [Cardiosporidium cionae]|eukprot:KAF8820650.1 hypothetical protein IE077_002967 [Cardiosporidium cionae]